MPEQAVQAVQDKQLTRHWQAAQAAAAAAGRALPVSLAAQPTAEPAVRADSQVGDQAVVAQRTVPVLTIQAMAGRRVTDSPRSYGSNGEAMPTATLISKQLNGWAPGTHHYKTSDGKHLAIEATPEPGGVHIIERGQSPMTDNILTILSRSRAALKLVIRPTTVFLSNENGEPIDADDNDRNPLTPLHTFPAGTTHEDALTAMGYTLPALRKRK
jgi:hypothetical protein